MNFVLRHFGVMVGRYPTTANRRRQLLMKRHRISAVLDIGANSGQYGALLREHGYAGRIVSYEPLPDAYESLQRRRRRDPNWTAVNKAVGDSEGEIEFHVAGNSESSSVLPMLPRHLQAAQDSRTIQKTAVRVTTLDSLLEPLATEKVLLKIDTQGYENHVLAGGRRLLPGVSLLEIEMSLVPLYEGQALFRELDSKLTGLGFSLVSICDGFFDPDSGELLQFDAIYANQDRAPA